MQNSIKKYFTVIIFAVQMGLMNNLHTMDNNHAWRSPYYFVKSLLKQATEYFNQASISNTACIDALIANNMQTVQNSLNESTDINFTDQDGKTLLIIAVEGAYTKSVQDFFDHNDDIDSQDFAPLLQKLRQADLFIVQLLLQHGADPRIMTNATEVHPQGQTALDLTSDPEIREKLQNALEQWQNSRLK